MAPTSVVALMVCGAEEFAEPGGARYPVHA
jgi:hypothetical protein